MRSLKVLIVLASMVLSVLLPAGFSLAANLVKDLNTTPGWSFPEKFFPGNGGMYFYAYTPEAGHELWFTDGTDAGTRLVKDIFPGVELSQNQGYGEGGAIDMGAYTLFTSADGVHGYELWRSDGTTAGTVMAWDINQGYFGTSFGCGPAENRKFNFIKVGTAAYFPYTNPSGVCTIGYYDGGAVQTFGNKHSVAASDYITSLDAVGNNLIFETNGSQQQVWDYDLARSVVAPLFNNLALNNQSYTPMIDRATDRMVESGGYLYFSLFDGNTGITKLQKSNLIFPQTSVVLDVGTLPGFQIQHVSVIGSTAYFTNNTFGTYNLTGVNLTTGAVAKVADLWAPDNMLFHSPRDTFAVGNKIVVFTEVYDSTNFLQYELWSVDTLTLAVVKLNSFTLPQDNGFSNNLNTYGGRLYFYGNTSLNGVELWSTDGTLAGTSMVFDVAPGSNSSVYYNDGNIQGVGTSVFFAADDLIHGLELWKANTTGSGATLVKDLNTANGFSATMFENINTQVEDLSVALNGITYYPCTVDNMAQELCRTDGTGAGTRVINRNVQVGWGGGPKELTVAGNLVFFTSLDEWNGNKELWVTDGTDAGSKMLFSMPNPLRGIGFSGYPNELTQFNGKLYFSNYEATTGVELWVSDGTAAGTKIVTDLNTGSANASPTQLIEYNGELYFSAAHATTGFELWKTDGTAANTKLVSDIVPGVNGSNPGFFSFNLRVRTMGVFNNFLYFGAGNTTQGRELWKTDGVTTTLVADLNPGAPTSNPRNLTVVGNELFFRANNATTGQEIYKCSTTDVCGMVKEIYPGSTGMNLMFGLTAYNGKLFFWAEDGVNGMEPWVSDGTAAGTRMLKDIMPGAGSSGPINPARSTLAALSDGVYFGANDGVHGFELWKTDGVTTSLFEDTFPGPVGGQIPQLREFNGGRSLLYFYAHPVYGRELFTVNKAIGPSDALALNLPLDGSLTDVSGNANVVTGVSVTPVADRFGVAAKAYVFEYGSSGYSAIKAADAPVLDTDTAFSLTAWVKVKSYGTVSSTLFGKWLSSVSYGDYTLLLNTNGSLTFTVANRTGTFNTDNVRTTAKLPLGEWAHVAATFNAGELKIYINGTLAASKVSTICTFTEPTEYANDDLFLGTLYNSTLRFNGAMDEARVYSRALTAAEVGSFLDYLPTPAISLAGGVYAGTQTVALSVVGEGMTIRYTLDGTTPTATTGLVYTLPLKLNGENKLRAVTTRAGFDLTSANASADYTINLGPVGGLTLYLPLDGNLKDSSGNNATATSANAAPVTDRKGFANRAYAFNPVPTGAMNVKVLDYAALDADNTFTLGAWVKLNSYNASTPSVIFSKWLSAASFGDYTLWVNPNGTVSFTVANTDTGVLKLDSVRSAIPVPLNVWTHVAATFNNGIMTVYINAIQQGTFTSTLVTHAETKEYNADDLYIGSLATGSYKLNGTVDEVRVYNRSLSNAEVSIMSELLPAPVMIPPPGPYTAPVNVALSSSISGFSVRYTTDGTSPTTTNGTLYAGTAIPVNGPLDITAALFFGDSKMSGDFVGKYTASFGPADNLALYLAFDGNANDTSGRNSVVTALNMAPVADVWGRPGMAYGFDQAGVGGSRVKILDNPNLDTDTAFTLSAWVRMNSYGTSNSVIFSKWLSSASAGDYIIWVNPNGTISFNVASTETGAFKIDSLKTAAKIPLGTWTHLAFTFNNGAMGVHINGSTVASKTSVLVTRTEIKEYYLDDLYLGSMYSKAYPFNGELDEVRVYGRALTLAEVGVLKNGTSGIIPAAAPLGRTAARGPVEEFTATGTTGANGEPLPGESWTDTASGITFTYVPAATFVMGSDAAPKECDASPAHLVSLSTGYWLGQTEVTQGQWEAAMGQNPSANLPCPSCPVENVTVDEINGYLAKLSEKSGLTYKLPTEAQWEYAARSGGQATNWAGTNNEAEAGNFGWLNSNSDFTTHAVGAKLPNGLGLNDLTGNVAEWTRDGYAPYASAPVTDPAVTNTPEPAVNVVRGGSYLDDAPAASTFCRDAALSAERSPAIGFRVVVEK